MLMHYFFSIPKITLSFTDQKIIVVKCYADVVNSPFIEVRTFLSRNFSINWFQYFCYFYKPITISSLTNPILLSTMQKQILLFFLILFCSSLYAQPGALDLTFNPQASTSGEIKDIVLLPTGKMLIAGCFATYQGRIVNRIARIDNHAILDTTFITGAGANDTIHSICVQHDGKILLGGQFTMFNGDSVNHIVRLLADGILDTSFHIGKGFNDWVYVIKQQPNGKIVVGGEFTQYQDSTANRIIRLESNGDIDLSWDRSFGANDNVQEIFLLPAGNMLIGGGFDFYGGSGIPNVRLRIARITKNGQLDSNFIQVGAGRLVTTIDTFANRKIFVGGDFVNYEIQPRNRIVRLLNNGYADALFSDTNATDFGVRKIKVLENDDVLIAGSFSTYNKDSVYGITRIDYNGKKYPWFNTGKGIPTGQYKESRLIDFELTPAHDKIYIVGNFWEYDGHPRANIARLYNCLTETPQNIQGPDTIACSQYILYSVPPVQYATHYQWQLPVGWSGSSDSTSILVFTDGKSGEISVKAFTDSCGFSLARKKQIYGQQPPAVNICLVTVDTNSTHNVVIWERPNTNSIDSFIIYREISTNTYTKVGAAPYSGIGVFHDYSSNPNSTSYRYKIASLSSCGVESAKSPYHQSIHLQFLGQGNFLWSFYEIEGSPNPVQSYNFYKDSSGNSVYHKIGFLPGTNSSFTDVLFNPNDTSSVNYFVDVYWNMACQFPTTVNTTRSNIKKVKTVGIDENEALHFVVYPNPTHQYLFLDENTLGDATSIKLISTLGEIVMEQNRINNSSSNFMQLDLSDLPKGVYSLQFSSKNRIYNSKVIVH